MIAHWVRLDTKFTILRQMFHASIWGKHQQFYSHSWILSVSFLFPLFFLCHSLILKLKLALNSDCVKFPRAGITGKGYALPGPGALEPWWFHPFSPDIFGMRSTKIYYVVRGCSTSETDRSAFHSVRDCWRTINSQKWQFQRPNYLTFLGNLAEAKAFLKIFSLSY